MHDWLHAESKVAVSAAAHLAAAKGIITRADLDGPGLCKVDPYEGGPTYRTSRIIMNESPGLGITAVPIKLWQ
jgi:L-alanine-DL-glutamate epimerase-like enolase superfamily enzyme